MGHITATKIYTIGHSNVQLTDFLASLRRHGIEAVADVRRTPYSRHVPQFNKRNLKKNLAAENIEYVYLGEALGGLPRSKAGRPNPNDHLEEIKLGPGFREAVRRLLSLSEKRRTVILCSEENPARCHRGLVLTPELQNLGARVLHIRADGRLDEAGDQEPLFG